MLLLCPRPLRCFLVGMAMATVGCAFTSWWPSIYKGILTKVFELKPGSFNFEMWENPPVPIFMDFYFFNWTNPEDLMVKGRKPHFIELGPYRFIETKTKRDVVWNANYTISFKQERTWYFDEENSAGSLSDEVTTLNAVALSAAYVARNWNYFLLLPLNHVLRSQPLAVTHSVGEFLFDGYSDSLIRMAKLGSVFNVVDQPLFEKFAWFYSRNGSQNFEGVYNMRTGEDDISHVADLVEWEYRNKTNHYPEACNQVGGTMGERFSPWKKKTESVSIYSKEICRSVDIDFVNEKVVEGLTGYRYEMGPEVFDNGTLNSANECFCGGSCVPSGVLNISKCQHGSPSFVSQPHFYQADPYYLDSVDGLSPDPEKHSLFVVIEPTTGVPLDVAGRLQINLLIQPYTRISTYENLPKIFFPMLWFEERATITPKLAFYVKLTLLPSPLGFAFAAGIGIAGLFVLVSAMVKFYGTTNKPNLTLFRLASRPLQAPVPLRTMTVYSPTTVTSSETGEASTKLLEHCNQNKLFIGTAVRDIV